MYRKFIKGDENVNGTQLILESMECSRLMLGNVLTKSKGLSPAFSGVSSCSDAVRESPFRNSPLNGGHIGHRNVYFQISDAISLSKNAISIILYLNFIEPFSRFLLSFWHHF